MNAYHLALQITAGDPLFWILVLIAVSFVTIAIAMVAVAVKVSHAVGTVRRLEERVEPLMARVTNLGEQVTHIAVQGRAVAAQVHEMSNHLALASAHFAESAALIRDEVRELKSLVSHTANVARDNVALVSRTVGNTQQEISQTTTFVQSKILEPAREIAAIMAGVRRGLEVFAAPTPKRITGAYGDDEMFIG